MVAFQTAHSLYTVDQKNKTVKGGKLFPVETKFVNEPIFFVGSSVTFELSNGQRVLTSIVEKVYAS